MQHSLWAFDFAPCATEPANRWALLTHVLSLAGAHGDTATASVSHLLDEVFRRSDEELLVQIIRHGRLGENASPEQQAKILMWACEQADRRGVCWTPSLDELAGETWADHAQLADSRLTAFDTQVRQPGARDPRLVMFRSALLRVGLGMRWDDPSDALVEWVSVRPRVREKLLKDVTLPERYIPRIADTMLADPFSVLQRITESSTVSPPGGEWFALARRGLPPAAHAHLAQLTRDIGTGRVLAQRHVIALIPWCDLRLADTAISQNERRVEVMRTINADAGTSVKFGDAVSDQQILAWMEDARIGDRQWWLSQSHASARLNLYWRRQIALTGVENFTPEERASQTGMVEDIGSLAPATPAPPTWGQKSLKSHLLGLVLSHPCCSIDLGRQCVARLVAAKHWEPLVRAVRRDFAADPEIRDALVQSAPQHLELLTGVLKRCGPLPEELSRLLNAFWALDPAACVEWISRQSATPRVIEHVPQAVLRNMMLTGKEDLIFLAVQWRGQQRDVSAPIPATGDRTRPARPEGERVK